MGTASVVDIVPDYYVMEFYKIDPKGRLKLGREIVGILNERNRQNMNNNGFDILSEKGRVVGINYGEIEFIRVIGADARNLHDLDTSALDNIVFITTGTLEGQIPHFKLPDHSDRVFIYAATDAPRVLTEIKNGTIRSDTLNLKRLYVDDQSRIGLSPLERAVASGPDGHTYVIGHPLLYCITLNKPPIVNGNNLPAQLGQHHSNFE